MNNDGPLNLHTVLKLRLETPQLHSLRFFQTQLDELSEL